MLGGRGAQMAVFDFAQERGLTTEGSSRKDGDKYCKTKGEGNVQKRGSPEEAASWCC